MGKTVQPDTLSDSEMVLLQILWKIGPATAKQVQQAYKGKASVAYSTVITLLLRMEEKGIVSHKKAEKGKAFVFYPLMEQPLFRKKALRNLVNRVFGNDFVSVFSTLVETRNLTLEEIQQARELIDKLELQKRE